MFLKVLPILLKLGNRKCSELDCYLRLLPIDTMVNDDDDYILNVYRIHAKNIVTIELIRNLT